MKIVLDQEQQEAVTTDKKKVIVSAGAGSGKTRVLVERVRYLLSQGVEPSSIVAITFTNMAAEEMRERLSDMPGIGDAFVGTIHSFANRLMRLSGQVYEIFNEEKDNMFSRYLILKYCKYLTMDKYLMFRELQVQAELGKIDESVPWDALTRPERYEVTMLGRSCSQVDDYIEQCQEEGKVIEYPESVATVCKRNDVITFDELLVLATQYFESLHTSVEHVLVDEFQDIGTLEYEFIMGLNAVNYFFVGDDWQAIYSFKGGNMKIFSSLAVNPEYTLYELVNNYRCGCQIVNTAAKVVRQAGDVMAKEVKAIAPYDGAVYVASRYDIRKQLKRIQDYGSWFVLTRTNKDLIKLSELLTELEIPYTSFKKGEMSLAELKQTMGKDTVKLLTVHSAKGLEADNVLLYGPFPMNVPGYVKQPEERRIMYVGMTRARKKLVILN